jgi:hypothetical protein
MVSFCRTVEQVGVATMVGLSFESSFFIEAKDKNSCGSPAGNTTQPANASLITCRYFACSDAVPPAGHAAYCRLGPGVYFHFNSHHPVLVGPCCAPQPTIARSESVVSCEMEQPSLKCGILTLRPIPYLVIDSPTCWFHRQPRGAGHR